MNFLSKTSKTKLGQALAITRVPMKQNSDLRAVVAEIWAKGIASQTRQEPRLFVSCDITY
jgi:hypothetical protein